MMVCTHVVLDGMQDPALGQLLSGRWAEAGYCNAVDVAGQAAWLGPFDHGRSGAKLTERDMNQATEIARGVGVMIRDRVGNSFRPDNDLATIRQRMAYEYKSRLVTVLVFGLPAAGLHYAGPVLAGGVDGPGGARWMVYPWLFELLLVGWACVAGGWPILWQGAVSLANARVTGDLMTSVLVVAAWVSSAAGVLSLVWTDQPWFGTGGPVAHAALAAMALALMQRWGAHRYAVRLSGRSNLMIPRFGKLVLVWLVLSLAVTLGGSWPRALAFGLLMPPLMSLGAVNPWSPGGAMVLPVLAFAGVFLVGPRALDRPLEGVEIEVATGFGLLMTLLFAVGWRRTKPLKNKGLDADEKPSARGLG